MKKQMKKQMKKLKKAIAYLNDAKALLEAEEGTPLPDLSDTYAVIWHYKEKNGTKLERAGLARDFEDPRPATEKDEKGFSPFDDIMPWEGMKIQNLVEEKVPYKIDTMVRIPEFYYFAFKDTVNKRWIWAISPGEKEGFTKHPGSGRLVGRYHMSAEEKGVVTRVYSRQHEEPLVNTSWTELRKLAKEKGAGWGMMDIATWSAIQLLYLVEFADFDSKKALGEGFKSSGPGMMGGTAVASYHTMKRTGGSNQYRNIEDPFSNVFDWIDGCYARYGEFFVSEVPERGCFESHFKTAGDGWIKNFAYNPAAPWAFIPSRVANEYGETDIPEYTWTWDSSSRYPAYVGGSFSSYRYYGLFFFGALGSASGTSVGFSSRLQKT